MKQTIEKESSNEQVWNRNTDLCMDVKTILRSDRVTKIGKGYPGVLTRDTDEHYTFIETVPSAPRKRNPHVFKGKFITVTRRDDGSVHPNFKPLKIDEDFCLEQYAIGVSNELLWALEGLIEE